MKEKTAEKTSLEIVRFINCTGRPRLRCVDRSGAIKEMVGTRKRSDPELNCRRTRRRQIPLGPDQSRRGGDERVRRIQELIPGKKIVFTWKWDDDEAWEHRTSVVTIELFERSGGTELRFRHEQLPSEESRDRHNEGWNSLLDRT